MADEKAAFDPRIWSGSPSIIGGYARPEPSQPDRTWGEALTDPLLTGAAAGVGMLRGIAGTGEMVRSAISTDVPGQQAQRKRMDTLADIESWIKGSRSDSAQYLDEHGGASPGREFGRWAIETGAGLAPYTALIPLGPYGGAAAMTGISAGQYASDARETLRQATPEQLKANPQYQAMIARGMSPEQAKEALYSQATDLSDPETWARMAPAAVTNALGFGVITKSTQKIMRKTTDDIVDRIVGKAVGTGGVRQVAAHAGLGAGIGALQGAGTEWSRQMGDQATGMRKDLDIGKIGHAAIEPAALVGVLTGAGRGAQQVRNALLKRRMDRDLAALEDETGVGPVGGDIEAVQRASQAFDQGNEPAPAPFGTDLPEPQPVVPPKGQPAPHPEGVPPGADPRGVPLYEPGREPTNRMPYDAPAPYGVDAIDRPTIPDQRIPTPAGGPAVPVHGPVPEQAGRRPPPDYISRDASPIGQNAKGEEIWERANGKREFMRDGAVWREQPGMPPDDFVTAEEAAKAQASLAAAQRPAVPAAQAAPATPVAPAVTAPAGPVAQAAPAAPAAPAARAPAPKAAPAAAAPVAAPAARPEHVAPAPYEPGLPTQNVRTPTRSPGVPVAGRMVEQAARKPAPAAEPAPAPKPVAEVAKLVSAAEAPALTRVERPAIPKTPAVQEHVERVAAGQAAHVPQAAEPKPAPAPSKALSENSLFNRLSDAEKTAVTKFMESKDLSAPPALPSNTRRLVTRHKLLQHGKNLDANPVYKALTETEKSAVQKFLKAVEEDTTVQRSATEHMEAAIKRAEEASYEIERERKTQERKEKKAADKMRRKEPSLNTRESIARTVFGSERLSSAKAPAELAGGKGGTVEQLLNKMFGIDAMRRKDWTLLDKVDMAEVPLRDATIEQLKGLANYFIETAKLRRDLIAHEYGEASKTGSKEVSWRVPDKRRGETYGEKGQWYNAIGDMNTLAKELDTLVKMDRPSESKLRLALVDAYIFDRVMTEGRVDKWEQIRRDDFNTENDANHKSLAKYKNLIAEHGSLKQVIDRFERRFHKEAKDTPLVEEVALYEDAKKRFDEKELKRGQRGEKYVLKKMAAMEEASGLADKTFMDPDHVENAMIDRIDNVHRMVAAELEERGIDTARAKLAKEGLQKLNDKQRAAVENKMADLTERGAEVYAKFDTATDAAEKAALEKELVGIERQLRVLRERSVPGVVNESYGIRRVLDGSADLSDRRNLPDGAYVSHVSDYLKPGTQQSIIPVQRLSASGKPIDTSYGTLRRYVLDLARKVSGDVEVVALTPEQMVKAAEMRDLAPNTPAFYDPKAHRILIDRDVLNGPDRAQVLGHEITHPLSEVSLQRFPDIAKRLDDIRAMAFDAWKDPASEMRAIMAERAQGFENVHEFLSELYNDGGMLMKGLSTVKVPQALQREMGTTKARNLLMKAVDALRDGLSKMFWQVNKNRLLSHAVANSVDMYRLMEEIAVQADRPIRPEATSDMKARPITAEQVMDRSQDWIGKRLKDAQFRWSRMGGRTGFGLMMHDTNELARRADVGTQQRAQKIDDALGKTYSSNSRIMDVDKVNELGRQIADTMHRMSPQHWENYQNYYDKENRVGVTGAMPLDQGVNKWVSPNSLDHAQVQRWHKELEADWKALPDRAKRLHTALRKFYDKRHNDMANAQVMRLVEMKDMVPSKDANTVLALVEWIRDSKSVTGPRLQLLEKLDGFGKGDDAAHLKFRDHVREIRELPHLRKLPGVWFPMMREGSIAMEGTFNFDRIGKRYGGVHRGDGVWEFETADQRKKFVDEMIADKAFGDLKMMGARDVVYEKDPATGGVKMSGETPVYATETKTRQTRVAGERDQPGYVGRVNVSEHRRTQKESAGDPDVVHRYTVEFNPMYFDMFKDLREGTERYDQLRGEYAPGDLTLSVPEPVKDRGGTYLPPQKADRALRAMMTSLEHSEGWRNADTTTRAMLKRDLETAAVRHVMAASARATHLPRKYALGARKDIMKDFMDYSVSTGYALAEVRHRNELRTALKNFDEHVDQMARESNDGYGVLRRQLQQAFHKRVLEPPSAMEAPWFKKAAARALQLSYMDKLISPMNWVLNSTEILMLGAPLLAGHHGFKAYAEVLRAYRAVKVLQQWGEGFKDAKTVYDAGVDGIPLMQDVPKRFKDVLAGERDAKDLHKVIDWLETKGYLDRDSSMEISRIVDPSANKAFRVADWIDNTTRQISAQIDNTNRVVMGIAGYRLGRAKGWDHEKSLRHAEQMVHDTTGLYAKYAEPELFRTPYLSPALQFKRYAQRITANYVRMLYNAVRLDKSLDAPERIVALKQIGMVAATMSLMSGVMGLPTEPIKAVINGMWLMGLTSFNSDDAENWVRQRAANIVGKDLGEIMTRGLPRYLGFGIGTRLAHDSLWTYGALGKKPDDWLAAIGHLVGGAPMSLAFDTANGAGRIVDGLGSMMKGQTTDGAYNLRMGAQLLLPIKTLSDLIEHTSNYVGGKETRVRSGQPLGFDPTLGETAMGIAGLRSGRSQEISDKRQAILRYKDKAETKRDAFYQKYVHASTPGEKAAIRKEVEVGFNKDYPEFAIRYGDWVKAQQRFDKKQRQDTDLVGLTLSRRQQGMLGNFDAYMTR